MNLVTYVQILQHLKKSEIWNNFFLKRSDKGRVACFAFWILQNSTFHGTALFFFHVWSKGIFERFLFWSEYRIDVNSKSYLKHCRQCCFNTNKISSVWLEVYNFIADIFWTPCTTKGTLLHYFFPFKFGPEMKK